MPLKNDDSDMKIVGSENNDASASDAIDAGAFLRETGRQHFNGNMSKARSLGADTVGSFSCRGIPEDIERLMDTFRAAPTEMILDEIRILKVFCAEYCMDRYLPSPLLSTAAAAEMFDGLKEAMPEFYERLSHSASFSFYYLCLNRNGELKRNIGEAFAEMCDMPTDNGIIGLGSALFEKYTDLFKKTIKAFAFV